MARNYEATFIFSSALDDEALEREMTTVGEIVAREGGTVKEWDKWGRRRLAYEINGQTDGVYAFLTFEGEPAAIERMGQVYRLNENILRHMHIVLDD
jgi:small subunit ribosomal protein S6